MPKLIILDRRLRIWISLVPPVCFATVLFTQWEWLRYLGWAVLLANLAVLFIDSMRVGMWRRRLPVIIAQCQMCGTVMKARGPQKLLEHSIEHMEQARAAAMTTPKPVPTAQWTEDQL